MVLNIFPRRDKPATAPAIAPEGALPEPSPEVLMELDEPAKRVSRRGSRGGRSRVRGTDTSTSEVTADVATDASLAVAEPVPAARAPRRGRAKPGAANADVEAAVAATTPAVDGQRPARRGTARQQAEQRAREAAAEAAATDLVPEAAPGPSANRGRGGSGSDAALLRAIEQQSRQIEQLIETVRRGGGGAVASAKPARVGVFVDAANVELASDRLRARFDWTKILDMLTRDRQLVRAIAYSPVHDDPGVSIETQRFVEPFLGKGYKVVTKPLKRFQDGTIKANVDIEMALDVIEMLDRLDVVCLVSGDGDFQRLVEVVQSKGVRVEVVAVGNSTAGNLRNAADQYIDLQQRLRDVRA